MSNADGIMNVLSIQSIANEFEKPHGCELVSQRSLKITVKYGGCPWLASGKPSKTSVRDLWLILVAVALLSTGCGHTSDSKIEELFDSHQAEFEELLGLAAGETSIKTISPDYIVTSTRTIKITGVDLATEAGMSRERWLRYKHLFDRLGLRGGVKKDGASTAFEVDPESFLNGASAKGILYSAIDQRPLVRNLDSFKPTPDIVDEHGGFVAYKQLKPRWYVYLGR